jgi:hypothetical protein
MHKVFWFPADNISNKILRNFTYLNFNNSFQHIVGFKETKSLASGKSKGALLVSAIAEIINKKTKGNKGKKLEIID